MYVYETKKTNSFSPLRKEGDKFNVQYVSSKYEMKCLILFVIVRGWNII